MLTERELAVLALRAGSLSNARRHGRPSAYGLSRPHQRGLHQLALLGDGDEHRRVEDEDRRAKAVLAFLNFQI
jgi:hypothetical protein